MQAAVLVLILLIALGVLVFVGVNLFEMKNEADKYLTLKKTTKDSLIVKKERLVKRLSKTQLNTLLNALKN